MVNTNLSIVRLEGSKVRVHRLLKDINGRASIVVHGGSGILYVGVPSCELGWLDKVARDIGCKKQEMQGLPEYGEAPCGLLTTSVAHHTPRCKKCTALRPPKPHNGEAVTVVKVEGLHDLTFNGLLELMRKRMDEALVLAQEYDTVIKAAEKIPELETQLKTYQEELGDHKQALRHFAGLK